MLGKLTFEKSTDNTIVSLKAFKAELSKVRKRGFAIAIDEDTDGLSAVAAPLRGKDGEVLSALTVLVPTARVSRAKLIDEYAPQVTKMAGRISFDMGFREDSGR